jgi:hypothetical protein
MHFMHGNCHQGSGSFHGFSRMGNGDCQCHGMSANNSGRHFLSPEEHREMLDHYIENLKNELAGAEEKLRELS